MEQKPDPNAAASLSAWEPSAEEMAAAVSQLKRELAADIARWEERLAEQRYGEHELEGPVAEEIDRENWRAIARIFVLAGAVGKAEGGEARLPPGILTIAGKQLEAALYRPHEVLTDGNAAAHSAGSTAQQPDLSVSTSSGWYQKVRQIRAAADKLQIANARRRGELVPADEVQRRHEEILLMLRDSSPQASQTASVTLRGSPAPTAATMRRMRSTVARPAGARSGGGGGAMGR